MSDEILSTEAHRDVGLHDCQPRDRIEQVVKPAIDAVFAMTDVDDLARYCGDITRPPEARLFAAAKCQAALQVAAAERAWKEGELA